MNVEIAKLSSQGRVTIPKDLRIKHNIKPGTKISFIEKEGEILLKPVHKKYFEELAGMLRLKGNMLKSLIKEKNNDRQ